MGGLPPPVKPPVAQLVLSHTVMVPSFFAPSFTRSKPEGRHPAITCSVGRSRNIFTGLPPAFFDSSALSTPQRSGWNFEPKDAADRMLAAVGYAKGVPMGGDLQKAPAGKAPTFLVGALKDAIGANLDRIQIVKGWLDARGELHEKVYDVAWSGGRKVDPKTGKLPSVGSTVDVENATFSNSIGTPELGAVWKDPDFDPSLRAFYYARVIEIPTPRWTAYDAKRFGVKPLPGTRMTITERAYTSPIWYTP